MDSSSNSAEDLLTRLVLISNDGSRDLEVGAIRGERKPRDLSLLVSGPRAVVPLPPEQPRLGFVVVIDPLALRRDCIARVVQTWISPSQVISVGSASELTDTRTGHGKAIKLALMNIGSFSSGDPFVASNLAWLSQHLPDVPIVVLGDDEDADGIVELMGMGIRGFVPTSIEPRVARCALELVEAGGCFVPATALLQRLRATRQTRRDTPPVAAGQITTVARDERQFLSDRQNEVMQLIARGMPNKIIARKLGMCESTVKVHVRQILRKLGAKNRTEVALMSVKGSAAEV